MPAFRTLAALATYNLPPLDRTDMLHEALIAGAVVTVALSLGAFVLALGNRRKQASPSGGVGTHPPGDAPASPVRNPETDRTDDARVEAELRSRAKTRTISEGKDVDDGILSTLTSVAETLDSTRVKIYTHPYDYEQQVKQCIQTLQGAIRDLRACVVGPSSKVVRTADFRAALEKSLAPLKSAHSAQFDQKIEEDAVAALSPGQLEGLLQIAVEASTNALRHGHSRIVTLRLVRDGHAATFVVQDSGRGFAPDLAETKGKGMPLMRTVAQRIGATLDITTRIGNGTRVVVTLPDAVQAPGQVAT